MSNANTQANYPYKHYYSTPERMAQRAVKGELPEGWEATTSTKKIYTQESLQKLFTDAAKKKVPETKFARIKTQSYLKYNYGAKVYTAVLVPTIEEAGGFESQKAVDALKALGLNTWEFMFINRGDLTALIEAGIDPASYKVEQEVTTAKQIGKKKRTDVDELFSGTEEATEEDI